MTIHREPLTCEIYGKEFYLAHGDGLGDNDRKFKFLRAMFHSKLLQRMFSSLHPRWSIDFGLEWAKHSRMKRENGREPEYMGEDKEPLVLYTKEYLKNHPDINYFIYGHRHIMLDLMLTRDTRLTILGDWINDFRMPCLMEKLFPGTIHRRRDNTRINDSGRRTAFFRTG